MLGKKLKYLREKMMLTQEELAKQLQMSRGTYAHYEIGKRSPDLETLAKLASFFSVSTDYLLNVSDEKFNQNEASVSVPKTKRLIDAYNEMVEKKDRLKESSPDWPLGAKSIIEEAETMDLSPEEQAALELYKKMPPDEQQKELLETVMELLLDLPAKDREVIMKMIKAYALSLR